MKRGYEYFSQGNLEEPLQDFNEAINLDPKNPTAYHLRGMSFSNIFKSDQAILDFNEAIRLKPDFSEAYYERGAAWSMEDDLDKAIADFSQAIRLIPSFADAYIQRGSIYDGQKRYEEALTDFNEGIRINPKSLISFIAFRGKGEILERKGDLNSALLNYQDYARQAPNDPNVAISIKRVQEKLSKLRNLK